MSVNSRSKGQRGEYKVRDLLREYTGYQWERVPSSGALSFLKGDIYIPDVSCSFLIEVKNYEETPLTDKIFTNKNNYIAKWWEKALEQAKDKDQDALVVFKYNRSKWFVITSQPLKVVEKYMYLNWLDCYICLFEEWLNNEKLDWVKQ